jgi:hypothetical protein
VTERKTGITYAGEQVRTVTRDEKIKFITQAIWDIEGASVLPGYFDKYTDDELDKEVDWYDHLLDK